MDLDFDKAANRLKKEQKNRVAKERAKREQDRLAEEEVRKKNLELEEINKKRRQEEEEKREQERLKQEEEERRTGGVDFCETYVAMPLSGDGEHGDRIKLPSSALNALQFKGAMDLNGPLFFSLSLSLPSSSPSPPPATHCSVLEFTAPDNTILLPPKVASCLGAVTSNDDTPEGGYNSRITVRYVRLEKGTFVRLQPRSNAFAAAVERVQGPSIPQFNAATGKWVLPGQKPYLPTTIRYLPSRPYPTTIRYTETGYGGTICGY